MNSKAILIIAAIAMNASIAGAQCSLTCWKPTTQTLPEPAPSNTLLPCEQAQGFKLLFDGTLKSFQSNFATYKANNPTNTDIDPNYTLNAAESTIVSPPSAVSDLRTQFKVTDFDYRLTYKNTGNEGVFYKSLTTTGSEWDTGVEFAIDDGSSGKNEAGADFDVYTPVPYNYNHFATGKWNTVRIVQKADSVEHWMNNALIVGYKFWSPGFKIAVANSKWATDATWSQNTPGCQCMVTSGFLGFQGDHSGAWHLKNMRVQTNAALVQVGPATDSLPGKTCGVTDIQGSPSHNRAYTSMERLPGAVRFNLDSYNGANIVKAEVFGLDGKVGANAVVENHGASILVQNWKQSGIYFLRVFSAGTKAVRSEKIFLP